MAKSALSEYLDVFCEQKPVLNQGLRAGELTPLAGQPGLFQYGLEALYADSLSGLDAAAYSPPDLYLSGLEASPNLSLDAGDELTIRAVQIFLNLSGYRGADKKPLVEDNTWGKNSATALAAWQQANAGKSGVSSIRVNAATKKVWMPSALSKGIREKLLLNARGREELKREAVASAPAPARQDSRNVIPSARGEASAGPGNVFELATNLRAILRNLEVNVAATGGADAALVAGWQRAAKAFKLNPAISADAGATQVVVNAATLSSLRVKANLASRKSTAPTPATRSTAATTSTATSSRQSVPTAGTLPVNTSEVQRVLRALGWAKSVTLDNRFGPNTQKAWESSATKRGLDKTISGAKGAPLVNVNSTTLARLQQDASMGASAGSSTDITPVKAAPKPAAKPAQIPAAFAPPPTPVTPAPEGSTPVATSDVQKLLIKLKWAKTGLTDGKFGARTQTAWMKSASARGLNPAIAAKAGSKTVVVNAATFARLLRDASAGYVNPPYGPPGTVVAPIATPVTPPPAAEQPAEQPAKGGLVKMQVGPLQDILLKLKFSVGKTGRDGRYGSSTEKAWKQAAANRSLDGSISRASPMEAWVVPQTLEQLSLAADGTVTKPGEAKPQPPSMGLVEVDLRRVAPIFAGFGKKAKADEIVSVWKAIAKGEKLDGAASVKEQGGTLLFYAVPSTVDALEREARIRTDMAAIVKGSDTPVKVTTIHDALSFWSVRPDVKSVYGAQFKPAKRGLWDANTLTNTLRFLNIPESNISIWERTLPKLVAKDKKSAKFPSKIAEAFGIEAGNFKSLKKVVAERDAKAEANEAANAASRAAVSAEDARIDAMLATQVKAATSLLSVEMLQKALNEVYWKIQDGSLSVPANIKVQLVPITGKWDAPTDAMFAIAYGKDVLGIVPANLYDDLLDKLLYSPKVTTLSGFGLIGVGRTYLRVPPAVGAKISDDASDLLVRQSKAEKNLVDPALISGERPPVVGEDPLTRGPTGQQYTTGGRQPEWTQPDAPMPQQPAQPAFEPMPQQPAPILQPSAEESEGVFVPQPIPAADSPAEEPSSGGGGGGGIFLLLGGAALAALVLGGKNKNKAAMPVVRR